LGFVGKIILSGFLLLWKFSIENHYSVSENFSLANHRKFSFYLWKFSIENHYSISENFSLANHRKFSIYLWKFSIENHYSISENFSLANHRKFSKSSLQSQFTAQKTPSAVLPAKGVLTYLFFRIYLNPIRYSAFPTF